MTATYTSSFDLTTEAGVEAYLADTPYACTKAEALSGGSGNFAFRLHLRKHYDGNQTLVLKHSRPYVKALPNIPFDVHRQVRRPHTPFLSSLILTQPQLFEAEALRRVGEWSPPTAF